MPLGLLLRVMRLRAHIDQERMAAALAVSQSTVSRLERGTARVTEGQAAAWLALCGAEPGVRELVSGWLSGGIADAEAAARMRELLLKLAGQPAADGQAPYFADIAAGVGEAQEAREGPRARVPVPAHILAADPGAYVLRVVGDSMAPRLLEGDLVVVSPAADLTDGCIVAARVEPDGDVVKYLTRRADGGIRLAPHNPLYRALEVAAGEDREVRVWGRVVYQMREM